MPGEGSLQAIEALRARMPEAAKDIRLNLQSVLTQGSLSPAQRAGVAIACGYASRNRELAAALVADLAGEAGEKTVDDAKAAAALMGMNNVYYRFRHMIGKPSYSDKRAGLRMNRIVQHAGPKAEFELYCLAVSAINGCEACVRSHEATVLGAGLTEDNVHDAVRIAATIQAAAIALEIAA